MNKNFDMQYTEEDILSNNDPSDAFLEFLSVLGDPVRLKGFDRYKGGLFFYYWKSHRKFIRIRRSSDKS